jgi:hypothetical protein
MSYELLDGQFEYDIYLRPFALISFGNLEATSVSETG